jgi:hypothetical protein
MCRGRGRVKDRLPNEINWRLEIIKKCGKITGVFFLSTLIAIFSLFFIIKKKDIISSYLEINIDKVFDLFLVSLPITFSIIFAAFSLIISIYKENENIINHEVDKINNIVKQYNCIMLKMFPNYTILTNELFTMNKNFTYLLPVFCD